MEAFRIIAERRINQAISEGSLTFEQWKDKPLALDDDSFVPADLQMAYKILKNSGYVPQEILDRKEVQRLEELIASSEDEHVRLQQMRKLNVLLMKMESRGGRSVNLQAQEEYYGRIVEKVELNK
ncbi:MAG: DnaJ family domain-containing protein [Thermodesulfobacteriota bacterium]